MTNILKVPALTIICSLVSCTDTEKKDNTPADENKPVIHYDKYIVELDKNCKVYKVTFTSEFSNGFTMEFNYLKDSIVKTVRTSPENTDRTTYYPNSKGLADSCKSSSYSNSLVYSSYKTFFYYDSTGYLKTSIEKGRYGTTTLYEYRNGNRITASFNPRLPAGIYSVNYQYDSSINLINIETFTGPWSGVLNKNLVIHEGEVTIAGSIVHKYYYILNSMGLPEKRTRITNTYFPRMQNQETTLITSFEYKMI